ncbi:hypothetical protein CDL15_Pgr025545 [Punica granatum]|nr:hypothetical protein CDL15_Pgr025545 [Punica granatum]
MDIFRPCIAMLMRWHDQNNNELKSYSLLGPLETSISSFKCSGGPIISHHRQEFLEISSPLYLFKEKEREREGYKIATAVACRGPLQPRQHCSGRQRRSLGYGGPRGAATAVISSPLSLFEKIEGRRDHGKVREVVALLQATTPPVRWRDPDNLFRGVMADDRVIIVRNQQQ